MGHTIINFWEWDENIDTTNMPVSWQLLSLSINLHKEKLKNKSQSQETISLM